MKAQRLHLKHDLVHYQVLSKFVNQHCQGYEWANIAQGFIRARNIEGLITLAKQLSDELFRESPWLAEGQPGRESISRALGNFRVVTQFVALVSKYPYDERQRPGKDPDAVALDTLMKDETRNKRLNTIFRAYQSRGEDCVRHPAHKIMRDVIRRVLGDRPPIAEILQQCDFSAGANVGISGGSTHIGIKTGGPISLTPSCVGYFFAAARFNYQLQQILSARAPGLEALWNSPDLVDGEAISALGINIVNYNEICCVPKNSDTARTIAKEPSGNSFVQKGCDVWMRERLLTRLNIDLTNQEINQMMAREGSLMDVLDPYVTEDVKSASNGVITRLVKYLLPGEWFSFLNAIRSPAGKWPDGEIRDYQLFSSMGNGFTFPLETLIFAAAVIAASRLSGAPVDFRVYGDDIICRQSIALLVIEVLASCGFRTNVSKTHVFGPFRESCGANWYGGSDVTPIYWRTRIDNRSALHAIHNAHKLHPQVQETLRSFDKEMPCVAPLEPEYDWVTDQAFRVPQDVWLVHRDVVWRRDTQSFRFPLLVSSPVKDDTWHADVTGRVYKSVRWFALIRGASLGQEFLKRKSTFVRFVRPLRDTVLECEVSRRFRSRYAEPSWGAHTIHAFNLLLNGGMRQRRAQEIARGWANGG